MESKDTFTLKSKTVGGQATKKQIFDDWGSDGENQSPALSWENAPKGTKSFAITVYDPDAPTGSGWWHWLVFDIGNSIKNIEENLYTKGIPDPEILIRTGNTKRLSNFLLWQLAYTEIFFEKKLWPDFNKNDFKKIISKFKKTKRNYGSI